MSDTESNTQKMNTDDADVVHTVDRGTFDAGEQSFNVVEDISSSQFGGRDDTPDDTPDVTPDDTPDGTSDDTPDGTSDDTPDVTPDLNVTNLSTTSKNMSDKTIKVASSLTDMLTEENNHLVFKNTELEKTVKDLVKDCDVRYEHVKDLEKKVDTFESELAESNALCDSYLEKIKELEECCTAVKPFSSRSFTLHTVCVGGAVVGTLSMAVGVLVGYFGHKKRCGI